MVQPLEPATPFLHMGETDCVAGVVGLELRNPLGSKSARVAGEFQPIWPKWRSRDGSRWSCGVAHVQLRQGFRLALTPPHGLLVCPVPAGAVNSIHEWRSEPQSCRTLEVASIRDHW
jgi:hypothetical protein